jgi:hypothetical protein
VKAKQKEQVNKRLRRATELKAVEQNSESRENL